MNAQIVIFFIAAVFQANAVPFLKNPTLGGLGQIGNSVVNQAKDVVGKLEEARETVGNAVQDIVPENLQDLAETAQNMVNEAQEQIGDVIENAQTSIAQNIEDAISNVIDAGELTEHNHNTHEAVGVSPTAVESILEERLPGIAATPQVIFNVADQFNQLHTAACDAVSSNFNIQNALCKQIKGIFRNAAKFITDSIAKILHSVQAKIVNEIERWEAMPTNSLDLIEESSGKLINNFEKLLKFFKAPEGFSKTILKFLRETTERNIQLARDWNSYIKGGKLTEIMEKIKTAINGGVPPQTAIQSAFSEVIQTGIQHFQTVQGDLEAALENLPDVSSIIQTGLVENLSTIEKAVEKVQEKSDEKMNQFMDKLQGLAEKVEGIENMAEVDPNQAQEAVRDAVDLLKEDFLEQIENLIQVPGHSEFKENIEHIFKNWFQDLKAGLQKIVSENIMDHLNTIKEKVKEVAIRLKLIQEQAAAENLPASNDADWENYRPAFNAVPYGGSAAGVPISAGGLDGASAGAGAFAGGSSAGYAGGLGDGTWTDPKKIFIGLI